MNLIKFSPEKKGIIFDFDGVLLDSVPVKTNAFRSLFIEYPSKYVDELIAYHIAYGGVSRFEKIRYFFNVILSQKITDLEVEILANKFSDITLTELSKSDYRIEEAFCFIEKMHDVYDMYIASAAAEKDLLFLCGEHGISKFFKGIMGSPVSKLDNVKRILDVSRYKADQFVMIGDSITDHEAAKHSAVDFYFYNNDIYKDCINYLRSFYTIESDYV